MLTRALAASALMLFGFCSVSQAADWIDAPKCSITFSGHPMAFNGMNTDVAKVRNLTVKDMDLIHNSLRASGDCKGVLVMGDVPNGVEGK